MQSIQKQAICPSQRARSIRTARFGRSMQQIAQLIKANVGVEVAFADIGGWDTHVNETGGQPANGQLANRLAEFGQSLAAFYQDLGDRMDDVTVVTMSEFGRTAKENGNRGTDHGHANVMFVMGGDVRGGKVYGDWPGLQPEQLYRGARSRADHRFPRCAGRTGGQASGQSQLAIRLSRLRQSEIPRIAGIRLPKKFIGNRLPHGRCSPSICIDGRSRYPSRAHQQAVLGFFSILSKRAARYTEAGGVAC